MFGIQLRLSHSLTHFTYGAKPKICTQASTNVFCRCTSDIYPYTPHTIPPKPVLQSQPKIRSTCTAYKICGERRVHLHLHNFLTPMLFTPETQTLNPFKSSSEGIEAFTYHPITLIHAPGLDIQCENSAKSSIYPQSSIRKSKSSAHAESR